MRIRLVPRIKGFCTVANRLYLFVREAKVTRRALTPCPSVFARPSLVDPFQVSKPQRSGRLEVIFEIFTQLISQEEVREGGKLTKKSLRRLKIKMAFVVL